MADYLCPNSQLSVEDQKDVFQIRSRTNPLPAIRGDPHPCACGEVLENDHIFKCDIINSGKKTNLENLINGSLVEMKVNLTKWRENIEIIDLMNSTDSV